MSAQVTILQLPAAGTLTGNESVPIVQNGQTVRTTTGSISSAGTLTQTFVTVTTEPSLANSRSLASGTGIQLVNTGTNLRINLNGASGSLEGAGNGFVVKNSGTTVVARNIAVSGNGISIANGDGQAGNPTITLTGNVLALAGVSANGLVTITTAGAVSATSVLGTANQIAVTNGDAVAGSPTVAIASNPVLPGTSSMTVPSGTTAQQPVGSQGQLRFNTDTQSFDGFYSGNWRALSSSLGVTTFSAGTTGLTPNTGTSGSVTLAGTLNVANGGTGATTANAGFNALSPMTTSGDLIYGGASGAGTRLGIGTTGQVLSVSAGGIPSWSSTAAAGVSTISFGSTGLTPATASTGAVTVAGTLAIANGGTGQTTASAAFNALSPITTTGDLILGNGTNSATRLAIGTNGYVLTSNGTTASWAASTGGVTSFTTSLSGLTPNTATTGAITLAGTLGATSGGTSQSTYTTGDLLYSSASNTLSKLAIGTTGQILTVSGGVPAWSAAPASGVTTITFGSTGLTPSTATSGAVSVAGTLITTNGGTGLSSYTAGDITYYATGTALSKLTLGTSGYVLTAGASAPQYVAQSTLSVGTATNATNVALTAGAGATNYIHFSSAATGNQATNTSTSLTFNATNGTITGGITGGTF